MDGSESDKPLEISFSGAGFLAIYHVGALKCIQVCVVVNLGIAIWPSIIKGPGQLCIST